MEFSFVFHDFQHICMIWICMNVWRKKIAQHSTGVEYWYQTLIVLMVVYLVSYQDVYLVTNIKFERLTETVHKPNI